MKGIPPSQKMRKKVEELLSQGLDGEGEITSALARLGMEWLVQELVEQEVTDYLGRGHYQRRQPEQEHRGYRNGYEPGRIRTAEGESWSRYPRCAMHPRPIVRA